MSPTYSVTITPVCYHRNPSCEAELKWALWGVLTVLKVLHSHGYVHRDIRWANVMKSGDNWLLLDYEHSEKSGKIPKIQLPDWPPEAYISYETSTDLYLVGLLISKSGIANLSYSAHDLESKLKQRESRPSASEILQHEFFDSCRNC